MRRGLTKATQWRGAERPASLPQPRDETEVRPYRMTDNMSEIHKVMGVCPQDNGEYANAFTFLIRLKLSLFLISSMFSFLHLTVLWNDLTAAEHLRFYARLRSVSPQHLKKAVGTCGHALSVRKERCKTRHS